MKCCDFHDATGVGATIIALCEKGIVGGINQCVGPVRSLSECIAMVCVCGCVSKQVTVCVCE